MTTQSAVEGADDQATVTGFTLHKRVAANVRMQMAVRQVSQTALAAHLGVAQQSVSPKVRGLAPFSLADIEALARWWSIAPSELLTTHSWPSPDSGQSASSGWSSRVVTFGRSARQKRSLMSATRRAA